MLETENLYKTKKDISTKEELTRQNLIKSSLVLFETDEGKIVTYDEFTGRTPVEEEPAVEAVDEPAEPKIDNPALYPLYKKIGKEEETADHLKGYKQVIVKFTDKVKDNEETA